MKSKLAMIFGPAVIVLFLIIGTLMSPQLHSATSTALFAPIKVLTACDVSTTGCNSTIVDLSRTSQFSVQAWYTGSPVGSFQVNVSNDPSTCSGGAANWAIATGTTATAISAAGSVMYSITYGNYQCLQAVYTKTSGTGTISVMYGSK